MLTRGERGGDPEIRTREFVRAMNWWGFESEVLGFPDLRLIYVDLETVVKRVSLAVVGLDVLVSFNPYEVTPGFDHPDHNRTGEVTRIVSTESSGKRGLLFWISQGQASLTNERVAYAKKFYPSQNIPGRILRKIGENYLKVR